MDFDADRCLCEINKLVALLRNTTRYADFETAEDNDYVGRLLRLRADLPLRPPQLLPTLLKLCIDPTVTGVITLASLQAASKFLTPDTDTVSTSISAVVKTKFPEVDREQDETVLLEIVYFLETAVLTGCADRSSLVNALSVVQSVWMSERNSPALKSIARKSLSNMFIRVIDGNNSYAGTVVDNCGSNLEILSKAGAQADPDRFSFLAELLGEIAKRGGVGKMAQVEYWVLSCLYHLLPNGEAANELDPAVVGQNGSTMRSPGLMVVVGDLIATASLLTRISLEQSGRSLWLEAVFTNLFIRVLSPVQPVPPQFPSYAGACLKLVAMPRRPRLSPRTILAVTLESLVELIRCQPNLPLVLFETFDLSWGRSPVLSGLLDATCAVVLSSLSTALSLDSLAAETPPRLRVQQLLLSLPDALAMDPPGQHLGYLEQLGVKFIRAVLISARSNIGGVPLPSGDRASRVAAVDARPVLEALGAAIAEKPKRTNQLVNEFFATPAGKMVLESKPSDADPVPWLLRVMPSLRFDAIGEFFGQQGEESSRIFRGFVNSINLKDLHLEDCLRTCLQTFRLPGESQQIDRVVEGLAAEYFKVNCGTDRPDALKSESATHIFLFAMIMLQTDQHNPQNPRRMEEKDFVRNLRGVNTKVDSDPPENISEDLLKKVFSNIRSAQYTTPKSASLLHCLMKSRWQDTHHLADLGYVDASLKQPTNSGLVLFLESKGYDLLVTLTYASNLDPEDAGGAVRALALLTELTISLQQNSPVLRELADDCVALLRLHATSLFSGNVVRKTGRNLHALQELFGLASTLWDQSGALLLAISELLILWAPFSLLLLERFPVEQDVADILGTPILEVEPPAGSGQIISSVIKNFFTGETTPVVKASEPAIESAALNSPISGGLQAKGLEWVDASLPAGFAETPQVWDLVETLKHCGGIERFLLTVENSGKISQLLVSCFELLTRPTTPEFLSHSAAWLLLLGYRLVLASTTNLEVPVVVACLKLVAKSLLQQSPLTHRCLKVTIVGTFATLRALAARDPENTENAWLSDFLRELTAGAVSQDVDVSLVTIACGPLICRTIHDIVLTSPTQWIRRFSGELWRDYISLVCALSPKKGKLTGPSLDSARKLSYQTAGYVLTRKWFCEAANDGQVLEDSITGFENAASSINATAASRALVDAAAKVTALGGVVKGPGTVWTSLHGRLCTRIVAVTKQKKLSAGELVDAIEMFRSMMANPHVAPLLTSQQAGVCIERSVSALSAVVVIHMTPASSVQAALGVFTRFFLATLDLLVAHPEFDKRWLSSLRVMILAAKRGQEDDGSSSLFEVMSEMLKNTLQLLVSSKVIRLLPLPPDSPPAPVWWKVTWDSIAMFCPGLVDEIREALAPTHPIQETAPVEVPSSEAGAPGVHVAEVAEVAEVATELEAVVESSIAAEPEPQAQEAEI